MVIYRESGVDLIQARGREGRFQFEGRAMRLGVFSDEDRWHIGVRSSSGEPIARLSLEEARTLKEAADMLKYGFFVNVEGNLDLLACLVEIGLLSAPQLEEEAG